MAHALFSPSSAHRWLNCPGSVALELHCPDNGGAFAEEGTAAHELAAMALFSGQDAAAYLGRLIEVNGNQYEVTSEMAGHVQKYLDYVRSIGGELMIEQSLPISQLTGEKDAAGTADSVIIVGDELVIVDLKYGRGVRVDADANDQLMIYAMAALQEYEFLADFKQVRLVIHQPRLDHVSEWTVTPRYILLFKQTVAAAAERGVAALSHLSKWGKLHEEYLSPGLEQCRFCKAKATCPALASEVQATVGADFEDLASNNEQAQGAVECLPTVADDSLGVRMRAVDLIEAWCKAVRAEVETRLLAGQPVEGFKLVEGRRGPRQWSDATEAETALKAMRLKLEQMYDLKLISPTTAEKLHKDGAIGPRQWPKLQALISQSDGKPSVAPSSDKRPALVVAATADEFEAVEGLV